MNVRERLSESACPLHPDTDVIIHPDARQPVTEMYIALEHALNPVGLAIVHQMRLAVFERRQR